jgi:hypothetical protein
MEVTMRELPSFGQWLRQRQSPAWTMQVLPACTGFATKAIEHQH